MRQRNLPPVGGDERQRFLDQAQHDFQDFAIIGDAEASLEDGILTLRVDLRPPEGRRRLTHLRFEQDLVALAYAEPVP